MDGEIVVRIKSDGSTEIRVFANSAEERDALFQKLEYALPAVELLERALLESSLRAEIPEQK